MNLKSNIKTILESQKRIISFEEFKKKVEIKDEMVSLKNAYETMKERTSDNLYKDLLNPDNKFKCILTLCGGYLSWYYGAWEEGTWGGGFWGGGVWKRGTWKSGFWEGGSWVTGTWKDGVWEAGLWKGGTWEDGVWGSGTWKNGVWEKGIWQGGKIYLPELKDYFDSPRDFPPTERNIQFLTSYYRMKRDEA